MFMDYVRIKWPRRKTSEINPGGPYFSAYIEIQFIPGKAVIFSHISVQSLGIPITQSFKKVASLPGALFMSSQQQSWKKSSHWNLYKYECSSHQLLREAAETARADKILSSLCFIIPVLQRPGQCSWYSTNLEQVSPAFLHRILSPRQHHQASSWCRSPACRICCRCSLRGERRKQWPLNVLDDQDKRQVPQSHHPCYILAQIRWNCSGSQSSCHHQLITFAGSCPPTARVARSPAALRQTRRGGCTRTAHRSLLLLTRQGRQNKHKIAVRKIEGLKYCSYEGHKNTKLPIRWVPLWYFVQITRRDRKEVDMRYTEVEKALRKKQNLFHVRSGVCILTLSSSLVRAYTSLGCIFLSPKSRQCLSAPMPETF